MSSKLYVKPAAVVVYPGEATRNYSKLDGK